MSTSIPLPLPLPLPVSLTLPSGAAKAAASPTDPKLAAAAKQFEAIFVRQMLDAARKASPGDGLTDSDAMSTFREMQDSQFADIAANKGAFGIAGMITAQLSKRSGSGG